MSKRDRQGVRTPAGLEQKYNFEKRFDEAMESVVNLDKRMNQTEIFNRLTNNGESQGVFMGDDGNISDIFSFLSHNASFLQFFLRFDCQGLSMEK